MRKPVLAIFEQQMCRSACAFAQSDQHLCCLLPRYYNISSFYTGNFKPPPIFCGWVGRIELTLVANPEDRFSRDEAHFAVMLPLKLEINDIQVLPQTTGRSVLLYLSPSHGEIGPTSF